MWLLLSSLIVLILSVLQFYVILNTNGAVNVGLLLIAGISIGNCIMALKLK